MTRFLSQLGAVLAGMFLFAVPAQSAGITKCTATITSLPITINLSGVWCLKNNLKYNNPNGFAIRVARKDVTIDLGGFAIDGMAAGAATLAHGIQALDQQNLTIRNGTVKGFYRGIFLDDFAGKNRGHLIENIRVDQSRYIGIYIRGDRLVIRNNHVIDTGPGNNQAAAIGILAHFCDNAHIFGNIVQVVKETHTAQGIVAVNCNAAMIEANVVTSVNSTSGDVGSSETGIRTTGTSSTDRSDIVGNRIINNTGKTGIQGGTLIHLSCIDNIVHGFTTDLSGCDFVSGNVTP